MVDTRQAVAGRRSVTALFVLLALAGPAVFVAVVTRLFGNEPTLPITVAIQGVYCCLAAALVRVALRIEHAPVTSLGLKWPTWRTFALAAVLFTLVQFVLPLITTPLVRLFSTAGLEAGIRHIAPWPVWFRLVAALTGGVIEETLYRGYATERLVTLTGSRWIGGALAALGFGLAHIPAWGSTFALAADLPFGVLMTFVYVWRRDLLANILAHSTALVVALLSV